MLLQELELSGAGLGREPTLKLLLLLQVHELLLMVVLSDECRVFVMRTLAEVAWRPEIRSLIVLLGVLLRRQVVAVLAGELQVVLVGSSMSRLHQVVDLRGWLVVRLFVMKTGRVGAFIVATVVRLVILAQPLRLLDHVLLVILHNRLMVLPSLVQLRSVELLQVLLFLEVFVELGELGSDHEDVLHLLH